MQLLTKQQTMVVRSFNTSVNPYSQFQVTSLPQPCDDPLENRPDATTVFDDYSINTQQQKSRSSLQSGQIRVWQREVVNIEDQCSWFVCQEISKCNQAFFYLVYRLSHQWICSHQLNRYEMSFKGRRTSTNSRHTIVNHRRVAGRMSLRESGIHSVMKMANSHLRRQQFKTPWLSFLRSSLSIAH